MHLACCAFQANEMFLCQIWEFQDKDHAFFSESEFSIKLLHLGQSLRAFSLPPLIGMRCFYVKCRSFQLKAMLLVATRRSWHKYSWLPSPRVTRQSCMCNVWNRSKSVNQSLRTSSKWCRMRVLL